MFKLYFYPYKNAENDVDGFQAKLINDFEHDYIYDIVYSSHRQSPQRFSSQILSFDTKSLNYLKFDHLNETPLYEATFWEKIAKGTGPKQQYHLKLKPKSFFKQKKVDSYTQEVYYVLTLEKMEKTSKTKETESLKNYTLANKEPQPVRENIQVDYQGNIQEKANFQTFIDLHIEMIAPDPQSMNSHEKLQYQIFKAREYLEEAVMLGIEKVYLLHGVGKGRLKDELAIMLKSHHDVMNFKNEFHGQYGWGATEVFLK